MFSPLVKDSWFIWVLAGTFIAGLVRGIAGFGGALVLIPILNAFFGPLAAVPILNTIDAVASAPLLPRACRHCDWKEVGPLLTGAILLLPVGVMLLTSINPDALRQITALVLLIVVVLMASGIRLVERRTRLSSAVIGALSGLMAGSIGLSGPPIALFWLDSAVPVVVSRSNVIIYTALMTIFVIAATYWQGLFSWKIAHISIILIFPYALGIYAGSRCVNFISERIFRYFVLLLIGVVAGAVIFQVF